MPKVVIEDNAANAEYACGVCRREECRNWRELTGKVIGDDKRCIARIFYVASFVLILYKPGRRRKNCVQVRMEEMFGRFYKKVWPLSPRKRTNFSQKTQ